MNAIDAAFQSLRASGRKALMPFVAAGDPDLATTSLAVREFARRGARLVEIGFPYSDPIADGPVIQAAFTRALARGLRVDDVFASTARIDADIPRVAMVSYSLVHRRGPESFLDAALAARFAGAIVPDLPVDEAEPLVRLAARRDFKLILMVTPTTPPDRAARILDASTGFVYCVSTTGITGERDGFPPALFDQLAALRRRTDLPLCVGFGVSKPDHVRQLRDAVDGVIVGSAIVRRLEAASLRPPAEVVREIGDFVEELDRALQPTTT